jgi:TolB-like protein/tRNA A-37 threonylcarbamoyl transferase component Bud32
MLQPGTHLGPYTIVVSLGSGGMGEVYEARDTRLGRRVAIKTLRPELLSDPLARGRFEREAKALSGLNHPNICTVFDVGHLDGIDFIVMEYIEGQTLAATLNQQTLDEPTLVKYTTQIAEALAEAHDRGVLHRDIKPQNVMVTPRGQVKVLDFGLAKAISPADQAATVSAVSDASHLIGTAPYMSPEQVRGETLDGRTDAFSLGCVIYEAIAGRTPFHAPSVAGTMSAILTTEPVALSRVAPATSPELQRIVRKCLEKDRSRRYQTLRDVATDLENLLRDSRDIDRSQSGADGGGHRHTRWRASFFPAVVVATVGLLVILAAAAAIWRVRAGRETAVRSIAILPLKPLSPNVAENYLGLGIADAVISRLSGRPELKVRPSSAMRKYAGEGPDALQAGGELRVDAVLDGTWQRDADRLRVSVNLLRVADGASLWVDRFDLPASDIFALQDRVSEQLVSRLRLEVDNRSGAGERPAPSTSPKAYETYLQARFHIEARGYSAANRQNTDKAIALAERAVALDPNYADAHALLGFALAHTAVFIDDDQRLIDRATAETDTAERLSPGLARIHLNRAVMLWSWYEGWRLADSIREYRRAEQLDPALNDIEITAGYAHLGLYDDWRRAGERVIDRDPTNERARTTFVNEFFLLNLPEDGIAAQKRLLNQPPDHRYFLLTGRVKEAAPLVEAQAADDPADITAQAELVLLRALQGRHREAREQQGRVTKLARRSRYYHHMTYILAQAAALAGDAGETARWLQETIDWGFPCYPMFSTDRMLDRVRNSPPVQAVLARLRVQWEGYRAALH